MRPTIVKPIIAPVPLMTTAPMRKHIKKTIEPRRKPSTIGMNLDPTKVRASPQAIAIMPTNF